MTNRFCLAKSELLAEIMVGPCTRMDSPIPNEATCHVTSTTLPLFPLAARLYKTSFAQWKNCWNLSTLFYLLYF